MTTPNTIRDWFDNGIELEDAEYMIIVVDTYSHEDYPVYCTTTNFTEKFNEHNGQNMQRVMEVYDLRLDRDKQLKEEHAFHRPEDRPEPKEQIIIQAKIDLPLHRVQDLITNAFELGSNYWIELDECYTDRNYIPCDLPTDHKYEDYKAGGAYNKGEDTRRGCLANTQSPYAILATTPTAKVHLQNVEDTNTKYTLDYNSIKRGLALFAQGEDKNGKDISREHFADFISGNWGTETSDVFLQLCILGEIAYG